MCWNKWIHAKKCKSFIISGNKLYRKPMLKMMADIESLCSLYLVIMFSVMLFNTFAGN